jgi:antitoxin component of MazEF toxin-antitoxin module
MPTQKLYKNGNSVAVTIPKDYLKALKLNDESEVLVMHDADAGTLTISPNRPKKPQSTITPEFLKWLDKFNKQYGPALKELAKK